MRAPCRLVLFDLDDTVYDRTSLRPQSLLRELRGAGARAFHGVDLSRCVESVRRAGRGFVALGFPDLRHQVESPALIAGLRMFHGTGSARRTDLGLTPAWQARVRRETLAISRLADPQPEETWPQALLRELALRRRIGSWPELRQVRRVFQTLLDDPATIHLARELRRSAAWTPYAGFVDSWRALLRSGATCIIASEGLEEVQQCKLVRLGLGRTFAERLITTERAANPAGSAALRERVGALVDACSLDGRWSRTDLRRARRSRAGEVEGLLRGVAPAELFDSYPCVWALDRCSRKGPEFYARVIHAAVLEPDRPGAALDALRVVDAAAWRRLRVQVAMVGDDPARDVLPLQALLGRRGAWTGLLVRGRHARAWSAGSRRHPSTREYRSWEGLRAELVSGLPWARIHAVGSPPPLVAPGALDRSALRRCARSRLALVRRMGRALDPTPGRPH